MADASRMHKTRRMVGEILSQLLNVPILSGILVTIIFFQLPNNLPNRMGGFAWALLFMCLIPLCSLFFYAASASPASCS